MTTPDAPSSLSSFLRAQLHRALIPGVLTAAAVLVVLGAAAVLKLTAGVEVADLARDPAAVAETYMMNLQAAAPDLPAELAAIEVPFYIGTISLLGSMVWSVGIGVLLFAFAAPQCAPGFRGYLLSAAAVTAMLAVDDTFLIHERAVPIWFGIGEKPLFAAYFALIGLHLVCWRRRVVQTPMLLLGAAIAAFAGSIVIDLLSETIYIPQPHLFEDGFKFAGIAFWTVYHAAAARQALMPGADCRSA